MSKVLFKIKMHISNMRIDHQSLEVSTISIQLEIAVFLVKKYDLINIRVKINFLKMDLV
jgi:hypothetical protein